MPYTFQICTGSAHQTMRLLSLYSSIHCSLRCDGRYFSIFLQQFLFFQMSTTATSPPSGIQVSLFNRDQWEKFYPHTEMILNRTKGRQLFPLLNYILKGLDPDLAYAVFLHFERVDNYKWVLKLKPNCKPAGQLAPNFPIYSRKSQIFDYHSKLEKILIHHRKVSHFRKKKVRFYFRTKPGLQNFSKFSFIRLKIYQNADLGEFYIWDLLRVKWLIVNMPRAGLE